jgi:hypothetical protein
MRIYAVFVTRSAESRTLELAVAWGEDCVQADPDGWQQVQADVVVGDVHRCAEILLEVDQDAVLRVLNPDPIVIPAAVVSPQA